MHLHSFEHFKLTQEMQVAAKERISLEMHFFLRIKFNEGKASLLEKNKSPFDDAPSRTEWAKKNRTKKCKKSVLSKGLKMRFFLLWFQRRKKVEIWPWPWQHKCQHCKQQLFNVHWLPDLTNLFDREKCTLNPIIRYFKSQ